jgi:HAD superfamily hydrolase (TIGR01509 family)
MHKLIIFDMDGVLVDIKDIHYSTLNKAIEQEAGDLFSISYNEHIAYYDGLKTFDKLNLLTEKKGLYKSSHQKIWLTKQTLTQEYIKNLKGDKNILDTLEKLKNDGYILCVASNSIRETIKQVLLATGYMKYIDFFLSNEDVKNAKPNSEIYLQAMIKAGVAPSETLILEDSPAGVTGASNTGADVMIVQSSENVTYDNITNITTKNSQSKLKKWINPSLNIVIPMAGAGSRFQQAGYSFPKPLIDVRGEPMIKRVVDNLNIEAKYTYIVQKEHYNKFNLYSLLNLITPNCNIVQVEDLTEGAACTVLLAEQYINNNDPLLIVNSDQFIEWQSDLFYYKMSNSTLDGSILTFTSSHPKWSFVKLDDEKLVNHVAEKEPISDIATVGIYYWRKGKDFVNYAKTMIDKNCRINNEFYVCPVFNFAIEDNKKFGIFPIEKMWGLGTPEDLSYFLENYR